VYCGDANPGGNVALTYKGGCLKDVSLEECYRCTGCGGRFHKRCILKHFKLEKAHDWGRQQERDDLNDKITSYTKILDSLGVDKCHTCGDYMADNDMVYCENCPIMMHESCAGHTYDGDGEYPSESAYALCQDCAKGGSKDAPS
jgi:hypothetical protein